jgi:hypothetical protein
MLPEFFESPLRIQELRDGPDGRLLEGFAEELCHAGYAEITARSIFERPSTLFIGPVGKAEPSLLWTNG